MAGPILTHELRLGGRRVRNYTLRWCYAGWLALLFFGFSVSFFAALAVAPVLGASASETSRNFVEFVVRQQFYLLLLVGPALTAGAVTDEKARGTLQYLLTTDLTVGEILIGKLLARAALIGSLALLPLPFLCVVAPFAGLDLLGFFILAVCTTVLILSLGAAGLLASVWCRQTRNAVVSTYCCLALGYVLLLSQDFSDPLYPLGLDETDEGLRTRGERLLLWVLPWLVLGVACFGLAVWRVLPAYLRQLESSGVRHDRWWTARRPPIRRNPVLWKERFVEGIAPLPMLRSLPTWLAVLGVFLLTTLTYGWMVYGYLHLDAVLGVAREAGSDPLEEVLDRILALQIPAGEFVGRSVLVLMIAGLVVGVRCSGAVSGEREKKTWEALLLTPLEIRHLIRGKIWGILGATYPYLAAYAVPALAFSLLGGWSAVSLTAIFLAVTWLGMAYAGAAGIWCSVRSKSSWQSLAGTIGLVYVGGVVLYCVASPFIGMLWFLLYLLAITVDRLTGGAGLSPATVLGSGDLRSAAIAVGLAAAFAIAAWRLVASAEYRVSVLERTKHWRRKLRPRVPGRRRVRYLDE
jgi:ABC-type transport system involved in multi-copper enzyme maturation permease subunit